MKRMRVTAGILTFVTTLLLVSGCAPRGESKSLDQILASSKARYAAVRTVGVPETAKPLLTEAMQKLEAAEAAKGRLTAADAAAIATLMTQLSDHAGYTSRPALSELTSQYLALAEYGSAESDATVLLISRTYSLFASELETTAFKLG